EIDADKKRVADEVADLLHRVSWGAECIGSIVRRNQREAEIRRVVAGGIADQARPVVDLLDARSGVYRQRDRVRFYWVRQRDQSRHSDAGSEPDPESVGRSVHAPLLRSRCPAPRRTSRGEASSLPDSTDEVADVTVDLGWFFVNHPM